MKTEEQPMLRRRRWLLPLAAAVWVGMLAFGWATSMNTTKIFNVPSSSPGLTMVVRAGIVSFGLRMATGTTSSSFSEIATPTPVNQETLFPGWLFKHESAALFSINSYWVLLPFWLLIWASIVAVIALPGAWRRWKKAGRRGWPFARWCAGWTICTLALILTGRWWSFKTPRIDQTASFVLTGTPNSAVAGKISGIAYHGDGSPYPFLTLGRTVASDAKTDFEGKFEFELPKSGWVTNVNGEPIHISSDPDRPLFWVIREKPARIK